MLSEVHDIWCEILGVDHIKDDERFYDIGGNSILLIMILDAVKKKFDCDLPTTDIYLYDTVYKMTLFIEEDKKGKGL